MTTRVRVYTAELADSKAGKVKPGATTVESVKAGAASTSPLIGQPHQGGIRTICAVHRHGLPGQKTKGGRGE